MIRNESKLLVLLLVWALTLGGAGCRSDDASEPAVGHEKAPLKAYQQDLLATAFSAASAMPLSPHIKNRSRAQEVVVGACLALDEPELSRRYIDEIANWRRGAGYADLAIYWAGQGVSEGIEPLLTLAAEIAQGAEGWRKDRILARIAAARTSLGQPLSADRLPVGDAEWATVVRTEARTCPDDAFDEKMEVLEELAATEQFDQVKSALGAYAELHRRFYANSARRARIDERVRTCWANTPVFVRIELLFELADGALEAGDQAGARALTDEAAGLMKAARWQPRFLIPLKSQLAELRFRAGDEAGALSEIEGALGLFETNRERITNIYRAETIRPIAEAHHAMGNRAAALTLYKRAIEAGMENPNSRPRAEDLVATCCSLAVRDAAPDAALLSRIRQIAAALGDPW